MDFNTYKEKVKRTMSQLGTRDNQIHMAMGISTEASEILDVYKKNLAYGKPLDVVNIGEEIGDLMWYTANLVNILGLDMESILDVNIKKLVSRYPDKFDRDKAIHRDLKSERDILNELGFDTTPE